MTGCMKEVRPGVWRAWVDLPRGEDNKRRQKKLTLYATGVRDAQRQLAKLVADATAGKLAPSSKETLASYLDSWIDHKEASKLAGKTIQTWRSLARVHIVPHLGKMRLERITVRAVRDLHTMLLTSGHQRKAGGLSPRSVLHVHRLLSEVLKNAVTEGLIPSNPCALVTPPYVEKTERQIPDEAALFRLLAATGETWLWLRLPILLAAGAGLREGEVCGLHWSSVDLVAETINIKEQAERLTGKPLTYRTPKRNKKGVISLPAFLVDALRAHKGQQTLQRMQLEAAWQEHGLVVTQEDGRPRTPDNLSHAFAKVADYAGIPDVTFHDLRHCCATLQIAAGVPLKVVSERMRHSSITITADLYGHVMPVTDREAARKMDGALRRAFGG